MPDITISLPLKVIDAFAAMDPPGQPTAAKMAKALKEEAFESEKNKSRVAIAQANRAAQHAENVRLDGVKEDFEL